MTPGAGCVLAVDRADAHVHGPFTAPDATGRLQVDGLQAGGAALRAARPPTCDGNAGQVGLHAVAEALRIPGPKPDLLAGGAADRWTPPPGSTTRRGRSRSRSRIRCVAARRQARTAGAQDVDGATLDACPTWPRSPRSAASTCRAAPTLHLHAAAARRDGRPALEADGTLGITGGLAPVPALIGEDATLGVDGHARRQRRDAQPARPWPARTHLTRHGARAAHGGRWTRTRTAGAVATSPCSRPR